MDTPVAETAARPAGQLDLDTPVVRGDQTIASITIRKPNAGELRGLSLSKLVGSDVSELINLLPRITIPPLTSHEVMNLDPADLAQCAGEVMDFLLPKAVSQALLQQ